MIRWPWRRCRHTSLIEYRNNEKGVHDKELWCTTKHEKLVGAGRCKPKLCEGCNKYEEREDEQA